MSKYIGAKALAAFIRGAREKYCMLRGHEQVAAEINSTDFSINSIPFASMEDYMQDNYSNYASLKYIPDEVMEFVGKHNVTDFKRAFSGCAALADISYIDTSHASSFSEMFSGCTTLKGEFAWPISLASLEEPQSASESPLYNMFAGTGITSVNFIGVPDFAYIWLTPTILAGSGNIALKTICVDGTILYWGHNPHG